jgi:sugar phosphate isomerase/epimerase
VIDADDYAPDLLTITALLHSFVPELEKRKITLGIENHDRFKAKELANVMKAIDTKYVGICLDCVNSMGAGEGLEYVVDILAPYTVNLHIKDFKVERLWHNMGFTISGTPAGKGLSNIPMILEKLKPFNRCQSAVLEQWVPFDKDIEQVCKKEKEWASMGIQYLKQLPDFNTREKLNINQLT